jgi:hypothetical protein
MHGEYSMHEEIQNAYQILYEKPEGKKTVWPRHRWENNIEIGQTG